METIQFIGYSPEQLKTEIAEGVKTQLDDFLQHFKPKQPDEYLTRQQVSDMFGVHITTIALWQKNGTLKPLGIAGKVFFLKSDVLASLKPLNV